MRLATLSPLDLAHSRLAAETGRAGGVGVLDAVHADVARLRQAERNATSLVDTARPRHTLTIGLRIMASQCSAFRSVIDAFTGVPHWLILTGWSAEDAPRLLHDLAAEGRHIWLEIGAGRATASVPDTLLFAGWAGCGAEAGGLTGTDSTFILAQHLSRQRRPFLLRGGIGLHTAAACRVAGAAAVVLDDAVLLVDESPLPPRWRHFIGKLGTSDTSTIRTSHGTAVRTVDRPDVPASRALRERPDAAGDRVGWDEPEQRAWPIGQGAGQAAPIAGRYRSIGRVMRAIDAASDGALADAARLLPLGAGAPLAQSHQTTYPIVQGPMTRVSDTVPFAAAVAGAGALPLFALALMRGPDVEALLGSAQAALGAQPWGVGILGFVSPELRREQLDVVERMRPAFALIAGGRPDQAADLAGHGVSTYLHTPAPLLKPYLAQGVRRFVFEGAECGGHIGPLHSFALWDYAVDVLAQSVAPADRPDIHVLFAGGIHDARSAAMVSALAAPLAALGMKVGVLMGTAYLFTDEAVACRAITPTFQRLAASSRTTALIETGPGHVIRCAPTPFIDAFDAARHRLAAEGLTGAALGDALDTLIVGRSRLASKGLDRRDGQIVKVDESTQVTDGLFMLGDVASLGPHASSIGALHDRVSAGATVVLRESARHVAVPPPRGDRDARPSDVAIIGAACIVPGARDLDTFWNNLVGQVNAITEIPRDRFDWRRLYDPDPAARDRIYSRWGGFVDPIPFDPLRYGIPPKSLPSLTIPQLMALELTRRALGDAGYGDTIDDPEIRARTTVVFGIGNGADIEELYITRATLPVLLPHAGEEVYNRLPEWTEESYAGLLASVVAGRVANRFDLGGPNLTVDAACASSLAAVDLAVRELADGRSDVAITGGIEFEMSPSGYMGFSRTRALSPRGRADTFDRHADGIVLSEGGVVVVLKRLADAERDGDRIYAVIKSVAGASDGRGLSLTAPKPAGQRLAIDRAYQRAGIDPTTIRLYEAHGTGTAVGDAAEVETIGSLLNGRHADADSCTIGSLKSLLGHTRTAAGVVALLKVALSLYHRVLPPHAGVTEPLPALEAEGTALQLQSHARPWLDEHGTPRRAGVSAFGFGGTNYHAVVEEYRGGSTEPALGGAEWPVELFVFAAPDDAALQTALNRAARAAAQLETLVRDGSARPPFTMRDLAYVCASESAAGGMVRVAVLASTPAELREALADMTRSRAGSGNAEGNLAFVFPGQGSQYPGMGSELALYAPEVRHALAAADAASGPSPRALSRVIFPRAAFDERARAAQVEALAQTRVAQPAIGALCAGMLDLARRVGLEPAAVAGHSYGELTALHAAGAFSRQALLRLSIARGRAMADVGPHSGAMAVVAASALEVSHLLTTSSGVSIANLNASDQVVISGPTAALRDVVSRLQAEGRTVIPLRVSAAFHSSLMAPARPILERALEDIDVLSPTMPVHANYDGGPYPSDPAAIRARLAEHLEQRVDFVAQIESMYASGVRTFLELGPGRVLTGLISRILGARPHRAIAADGGLRSWLDALATLFIAGHPIRLASLFEGRDVSWVDLNRLPEVTARPAGWLMDGGCVWPAGSARHSVGVSPLLDEDSAAAWAPPAVPTPVPLEGDPVLGVYREYEETMRRFLDQQERMLVQALQRATGSPARVDAPPAPGPSPVGVAAPSLLPPAPDVAATVAAPDTPALDRATILKRLVDAVCDRTGYLPDALGSDLDLEADLGIDSIKRMEVLGTVLEGFPANMGRQLQGELDRLTRQRSLNALADQLSRAVLARSPDIAPLQTASRPELSARLDRFVMRAERAPLDATGAVSDTPLQGLHLVTEDARGLGELVVEMLAARGAHAHLLSDEEVDTPERMTKRVRDLRDVHGPVRGIVHLTPVGRRVLTDTLDAWRQEASVTTRRLFYLLQRCSDDLERGASDARVLVATAMGGDWGRTRATPGSEVAGGCHGLVRSFERECPGVSVAVVDLDADRPLEELAAIIVGEYLTCAGDRDIGYQGADRMVFLPQRAALPERGVSPAAPTQAGWVVLATGGAKGITAEVCLDLVVPGVKLIVVGRTAEPAGDRRVHLDAFAAAGAEVEYHAVDVRKEREFGALIDDLYRRHGRIDAVLHGAGAIEDQRIEFKQHDSFDRVFDTKVDSAIILGRHLRPQGLKWVVLFSSVSGRFGNPGQGDYAAANEILNRLAWTFHRRWPQTRVVSINWGPWRGTGMMSGAILKLAAARGLEPIEPAAGRRFVVDELTWGSLDDVEVVAGAGPWRALATSRRGDAAEPVAARAT